MPAHTTPLEVIEDFLDQERRAMVGVSRKMLDSSVLLFQELRQRDVAAIPVHPQASDILGQRCFERGQDIRPPVDTALLMRSPSVTETVVEDCAEACIGRICVGLRGGPPSVQRRMHFCEENGI